MGGGGRGGPGSTGPYIYIYIFVFSFLVLSTLTKCKMVPNYDQRDCRGETDRSLGSFSFERGEADELPLLSLVSFRPQGPQDMAGTREEIGFRV